MRYHFLTFSLLLASRPLIVASGPASVS